MPVELGREGERRQRSAARPRAPVHAAIPIPRSTSARRSVAISVALGLAARSCRRRQSRRNSTPWQPSRWWITASSSSRGLDELAAVDDRIEPRAP